jgi:ABC-type transporter Mla subunit MlaD
MTNQHDTAQQIKDVTAQLAKAKGEIVTRIQELEDALANASSTTDQEVVDALAALKTEVQGVDDLNPDPVPQP